MCYSDFIQLIGSLSELLEKDYGDDKRAAKRRYIYTVL